MEDPAEVHARDNRSHDAQKETPIKISEDSIREGRMFVLRISRIKLSDMYFLHYKVPNDSIIYKSSIPPHAIYSNRGLTNEFLIIQKQCKKLMVRRKPYDCYYHNRDYEYFIQAYTWFLQSLIEKKKTFDPPNLCPSECSWKTDEAIFIIGGGKVFKIPKNDPRYKAETSVSRLCVYKFEFVNGEWLIECNYNMPR